MSDEQLPIRVVGFGIIPLPGEKARWRRARAEARRLVEIVEHLERQNVEGQVDPEDDR